MSAFSRPILIAFAMVFATGLPLHGNPSVPRAARSPLRFERNDGQLDQRVRFASRAERYDIFVTESGMTLTLRGSANRSSRIRMRLLGKASHSKLIGSEELPGKTNYYVGNASQWRENIPSYARAIQRNAYQGVDVAYHGTEKGELEFDFIIAPGVDPSVVRFDFADARARIENDGRIALHAGDDVVHLARPVAYQDIEGIRSRVSADFRRVGTSFGFSLGRYEKDHPLVIDPVVFYGTYLGGSDFESPTDLATDGSGSSIVTGLTPSANFPLVGSTAVRQGSVDIFVTKHDLRGQRIYSTIVGGTNAAGATGEEFPGGVAVDAAGNAYVTGSTKSENFPTLNALFPVCPSCPAFSAFLTKLSPTGALVYSTYLGASDRTLGQDVAVDPAGDAYVFGETVQVSGVGSVPFPVQNAFMTSPRLPNMSCCSFTMFLTRFNAAGNALVYSTLFGSEGADTVNASSVAVNGTGDAWITGDARVGTDNRAPGGFTYVTTPNAIRSSATAVLSNFRDFFVARFDTDAAGAASLVYSTLVGGALNDENGATFNVSNDSIAVDAAGNAYIGGRTNSTDFPTTPGVIGPVFIGGISDFFLSKINPTGTAFVYSTYFGSSNFGRDRATGIAIDGAGNTFFTGDMSPGAPVVNPVAGQRLDGGPYLGALNPTASGLLYSTYLNLRETFAVDVDACGNAYVVGTETGSASGLVKNAAQPVLGGGIDAFVLRVDLRPGDVNRDCSVTAGDIFYLINLLFANGPQPLGVEDANGDGTVTAGDIFYMINFLFANGPKPVGSL